MSALEVSGLYRSFGGLVVADSIDLNMKPGSRAALIGPNGAGKTTFINLVSGYLKPDAGSISFQDRNITCASPVERVRRGLVRTFQLSRLIPDMTVAEHLHLADVIRRRKHHAFWSSRRIAGADANLVCAATEQMGLSDVFDRPVSEIAYGQQRLVEIAIALVLQPKVLLLDEPAAGVPRTESDRIIEALEKLPAEIAVLMIEHDMDLVFRFARNVIVMANGAVIFQGTPQQAQSDSEVRAAYLGTQADDRPSA